MKLADAIMTGKPFRLPEMRPKNPQAPEVWLSVHDDKHIHVLGPDDILPWGEAIHPLMAARIDWEVKSDGDAHSHE